MKNKEDIGTLFEKKLQGAQKTPSISLWDRVDETLNKKDKSRKRIFWYWTGGAITLLLISLLYAVSPFFKTNGNPEKQQIEITLEGNKSEKSIDELPKDSNLNTDTLAEKKSLEIDATKEIVSEITPLEEKLKTPVPTSKNKKHKSQVSKTNKSKNKFNDENVEVKTTYYYYNSENDFRMETTNKKVIDSILNSTETQNDTIKTYKKTDSLNR